MLISWQLLNQFVHFHDNISPEILAERLTASGSEVEAVIHPAGKLHNVVAAKIDALEIHPQNDKYFIAHLNTGNNYHICVTSAKNMKQGDLVFYAGEGSVLPDGTVMGVRDFLGVQSAGMMLSAQELGLVDVDDPSGLLILPDDAVPGTQASTLYHLGDTILDVSITPNRGDLLSHLGMAREVNGLFPSSELITPDWLTSPAQDKSWPVEFGKITLSDEGCSAYRLGLADGAKIGPSPLTARVDLAHLGMRPINNAVDITNYVMLMLGQPLHAFDLNTLPAREITVRAAHQGEIMTTLDGKDRLLTEQDMLITSGGEAIALAGVMGGMQTGINDGTSTIVIESASFSPVRVGRTSRRLGINSEAAFRFARTVDPELSKTALSAACALMHDWCGADVSYRPLCAENILPEKCAVPLTRKKLSTYLNWSDMNEAVNILEGFGIIRLKGDDERVEFMPPSWRPDIAIEEDLIEEIGRYRGYNDAPEELPGRLPRIADIGDDMRLSRKLRQVLMARGYTEVMTYSFLGDDFAGMMRLGDDDVRAKPLLLRNPISREQVAMRTMLLPGLLAGVKSCVDSGYREPVRAFEQGKIFLRTDDADGHVEREHIAAVMYNGRDRRSVHGDREEGFYDIRADVEALLMSCGHTAEFRAGSEGYMHSGQIAVIYVSGEAVGVVGRLKPEVEQELGLDGVYVFEAELPSNPVMRRKYSAGSEYPGAVRDISLESGGRTAGEVKEDLTRVLREVLSEADNAGSGRVSAEVRMFDEYGSSQGWSVYYRSSERTLSEGEADDLQGRLRSGMIAAGYVLR